MDKQLFSACVYDKYEQVKEHLSQPDVDINARNGHGNCTPLMYACENGLTEIVRLLLNDRRTDVNLMDPNGDTAFAFACSNGHVEVVRLLLESECLDVNKTIGHYGKTALMIACEQGNFNGEQGNVVEYILASGRDVKVRMSDRNNKTVIDYARMKGNGDLVEILELFEENPNAARTILREKLKLPSKFSFYFSFYFIFIFIFLKKKKI